MNPDRSPAGGDDDAVFLRTISSGDRLSAGAARVGGHEPLPRTTPGSDPTVRAPSSWVVHRRPHRSPPAASPVLVKDSRCDPGRPGPSAGYGRGRPGSSAGEGQGRVVGWRGQEARREGSSGTQGGAPRWIVGSIRFATGSRRGWGRIARVRRLGVSRADPAWAVDWGRAGASWCDQSAWIGGIRLGRSEWTGRSWSGRSGWLDVDRVVARGGTALDRIGSSAGLASGRVVGSG